MFKILIPIFIRAQILGADFFDIIKTAVGEYAGGYGFPLPNPGSCLESISGYGLRWNGTGISEKSEDTWCRMLGHFRCRIRYSPENIQWAVARMAFYTETATRTATCMCAICISRTVAGTGATTGLTTIGAARAPRLFSQITSLLPQII